MLNTYTYEQQILTFRSKEKPSFSLQYILAKPADLREGEKLPLVISLHGAGERGTDINDIKRLGVPKYLDKGLPVRAIVLAPQLFSRDIIWVTVIHEVMELIRLIRDSEPTVDRNNVCVTGVSMGGYATWELAMSYTAEFAAIAPVCGGGTPWRAWRLANLPIRTYHGDVDDTVPLSETLHMVDAVKQAGGNPECLLLHGVSHDCWDWVHEHTDLLEWLISHGKKEEA
ncbi:MAG: hypothetical protein IKM59_07840 [Oscillospiraceae bacterium]|nr:hypothetical protein [Oscillospiraceae bacterium]